MSDIGIKIIKDEITGEELKKLAEETFIDMAKAVVDVEKEIMAIGGELHADAEGLLIENGSEQKNLWGINIYINKPKEEQIQFISLINVRPSAGNSSMEIRDPAIKERIKKIVEKLIG